MCKKSLRTAIELHERLLENGDYKGRSKESRKILFAEKLSNLEPDLLPCPFCNELPVYNPSTIDGYGMASGGGGWCAYITCEDCELEFRGSIGTSVISSWNYRGCNEK